MTIPDNAYPATGAPVRAGTLGALIVGHLAVVAALALLTALLVRDYAIEPSTSPLPLGAFTGSLMLYSGMFVLGVVAMFLAQFLMVLLLARQRRALGRGRLDDAALIAGLRWSGLPIVFMIFPALFSGMVFTIRPLPPPQLALYLAAITGSQLLVIAHSAWMYRGLAGRRHRLLAGGTGRRLRAGRILTITAMVLTALAALGLAVATVLTEVGRAPQVITGLVQVAAAAALVLLPLMIIPGLVQTRAAIVEDVVYLHVLDRAASALRGAAVLAAATALLTVAAVLADPAVPGLAGGRGLLLSLLLLGLNVHFLATASINLGDTTRASAPAR